LKKYRPVEDEIIFREGQKENYPAKPWPVRVVSEEKPSKHSKSEDRAVFDAKSV
jgi:hypothetical protein